MKIFQNLTSAELEAEADSILRQDREDGGSSPDDFELLNGRDRNRKDIRRFSIAQNNEELVVKQTSPEYRLSPEQSLIKKERTALAKAALLKTLLHFDDDYLVKQVVVAILRYDVEFRSTRMVAEACGMSIKEAHTAKERLKYFVQNDKEMLNAKLITN